MDDWDKERQAADQLKADLEKVNAEKNAILSEAEVLKSQYSNAMEQNESLSAELEEQRTMLSEIQSQLNVKKSEELQLPPIDPETASISDIEQQNRFLLEQIKEIKLQNAQYATAYNEFQQEKQNRLAEAAKNEVQEKILRELDTEFGPQYRNEAVKLATKWVYDDKTEKEPGGEFDAYKLCRKAYQAIVKKPVEKKEAPPSDKGRDSIPVSMDDDIGEGSIDTVLSKMRKSGKFKGAILPEM